MRVHKNKLKLIFGTLVLAGTISALTSVSHAYSGEQYVVCKLNRGGDYFLALRQCGSTQCLMLRKLRPGTFITSLNPRSVNRWREIVVQNHIDDNSYKGISGWVYDKYICNVRY